MSKKPGVVVNAMLLVLDHMDPWDLLASGPYLLLKFQASEMLSLKPR